MKSQATKPRVRRTARVSMVELLRPGSFPRTPYSLEIAFQTLRCLMITGLGYTTPMRWVAPTVTQLLGGSSPDYCYARPIKSIQDLQGRFQAAIFGDGAECFERWRREQGINAYSEHAFQFAHYKPFAALPHLNFSCEDDIRRALTQLLESTAGSALSVSLNAVHLGAKTVHRVDVAMNTTGFSFDVHFGFHTPEEMRLSGDSEWSHTLARTENDEPFVETLRRALDRYAFLIDPANEHLMLSFRGDFVDKESVDRWGNPLQEAVAV